MNTLLVPIKLTVHNWSLNPLLPRVTVDYVYIIVSNDERQLNRMNLIKKLLNQIWKHSRR